MKTRYYSTQYVEINDVEVGFDFEFEYTPGCAATRDDPGEPGDMELVAFESERVVGLPHAADVWLPSTAVEEIRDVLQFAEDFKDAQERAEADCYEQVDNEGERYESD